MKKVLVTGGAGFIGSHLSQALLQRGFAVRILDNLLHGKIEWIPDGAEFYQGDICNFHDCQQAMKNVSGIFHCAAMSRAGPSFDHIDDCTRTNILGTQNILLAAREAKVSKIIYSGSSTYYGNQVVPHKEYATPGQFLNFYALSKHVGERYCLMFDKAFNVPCIILRYFNVYGPRQPEEGPYGLVLGIFLKRALKGLPLEIHGDGEQSRDFIYVSDVVAANIAAFESPIRHEIFNIGSGKAIAIKKLASLISTEHIFAARRAGDAEVTLADINRVYDALQWLPKISLTEGLAVTKKYMEKLQKHNDVPLTNS